ncbi:MAG: UDP-N-acetylglucosamine pyrophosphorylase [Clostridiales bacterium]|nr:UDP-N-acetylglucosamine pyrophosphorylase [Clostridiales bacterium]
MLKNIELFENIDEHTICSKLIESKEYPWEVLPDIEKYIISLGENLDMDRFIEIEEHVWVHKTAIVAPTALLTAPVIIDEGAEIRHCAFIRGKAVVGKNAVVGNSCELKNVIIFDNVQVPHYNYVGDSILGYKSHMGAGSITSNVKSDKTLVSISTPEGKIETQLKKMGAILGDNVEVGCNSVLNPGTVIGKNSNIYPLSMVRGYVPEKSIYKKASEIAEKTTL